VLTGLSSGTLPSAHPTGLSLGSPASSHLTGLYSHLRQAGACLRGPTCKSAPVSWDTLQGHPPDQHGCGLQPPQ
jgi:hypothetical protein